MQVPNRKSLILIPLFLITPLGFLFKFYSGPGRWWFNDYGAGLLYELFWILLFFLIFPGKKSAHRIPFWAFVVTCGLECLQLIHPPFLEKIRAGFAGKALIGATFAWGDFPHYAAGCLMGWLYLRWMIPKIDSSPMELRSAVNSGGPNSLTSSDILDRFSK